MNRHSRSELSERVRAQLEQALRERLSENAASREELRRLVWEVLRREASASREHERAGSSA
ncbi:MAG: hypothetical protein R3B57_11115 [Phycisphaerales bacterium]